MTWTQNNNKLKQNSEPSSAHTRARSSTNRACEEHDGHSQAELHSHDRDNLTEDRGVSAEVLLIALVFFAGCLVGVAAQAAAFCPARRKLTFTHTKPVSPRCIIICHVFIRQQTPCEKTFKALKCAPGQWGAVVVAFEWNLPKCKHEKIAYGSETFKNVDSLQIFTTFLHVIKSSKAIGTTKVSTTRGSFLLTWNGSCRSTSSCRRCCSAPSRQNGWALPCAGSRWWPRTFPSWRSSSPCGRGISARRYPSGKTCNNNDGGGVSGCC